MQKMYSCVDIAERYGVRVNTVWDWIRKKKLPAMKIGKDYKMSDKDIEVFEDSCRTVK